MEITIRLRSLLWFSAGVFVTLMVTLLVMNAWRAEAAPGDDDATFVPITTCRLADTRPAAQVGPRATPLGGGDVHTIDVRDATTECAGAIPSSATGVALNVTAARTTELTFLTIWDAGPVPNSSSLNPSPGPPQPNAVTTKLAGDGTFRVYNDVGSTDLVIDVTGYYTPASLRDLDTRLTALETSGVDVAVLNRIETLEAENAALKELTASMSLETVDGHQTVRFTGVNVQVVSGSGSTTGPINGTGNLIVGYNLDTGDNDGRNGSHNLVVGDDHTYSSYGGLVAGYNNNVTGLWASVTGGSSNTASGARASVSGGAANTANGNDSSVSGGNANTATGIQTSVSGGNDNTAGGTRTSVTGGDGNQATGTTTSVTGGASNTVEGESTSITGGAVNSATGRWSAVSGGSLNTASGDWGSVSGGTANTASGDFSSVSGGSSANSTGTSDWRAGSLFEND